MAKLIRITTVPLSLEKLLEGQLGFMNQYFEVTAVSAEKERLEQYGRDNGVKTFWVEMTRAITPWKDLSAVWRLYRFLKKERPQMVHTHTPKAGLVGMLAAKMAGVPVRLHTVAGLPLMETSGIKRSILAWVEKFTYSLATKVYPNSQGLREIILQEGFAEKEKLRVLGKGSSNGIDTHYFDPSRYGETTKLGLRNSLGIPEEDLVFIFIGRLVSQKGINELITAFIALEKEDRACSLLLIGPFEADLDPLAPATLEAIEQHPKIFTTGYQQDVRPFLALAQVLVFPSYREGFPNVVMQAGAMGLPVIVSDINGCNEIVEGGKNGLIIPVKDSVALAQAMRRLSRDHELRRHLSRNARPEIARYYEREEYWQILLNEYKTFSKEIPKS